MVWVLSFCNGLCESKLWTQQFYHNTVAFIAEKRSFQPFLHAGQFTAKGSYLFADPGRPADSGMRESKR